MYTRPSQPTNARRLKYASRDNSASNARSAAKHRIVLGERAPDFDEAPGIATAETADRSRLNTAGALPAHGNSGPENSSSSRYFQNLIPFDTRLAVRLAKVQGVDISAHCSELVAK